MRAFRRLCIILAAGSLFFAGCDSLRSMVSHKNIAGRFYMGALNERKLPQLTQSMDKIYAKDVKETQKKKPYIVVNCVVHEVEKYVPTNSYSSYADWTNFITSQPEISVVSFGGRKLYFSEGTAIKTGYQQDLMAFYAAHVIAHSLLDHTNERLFEEKPEGIGNILEAWTDNTSGFRFAAMAMNGSPLTADTVSPYSEEMEKEADKIAINIIAYAGFNPSNVLALLKDSVDRKDEIYFQIHPLNQARFDNLATLIESSANLRALANTRNHHPQCENLQ
jgi:predicted Zn-dependent protease